jgi:DNA repair protein RecO (recombination protein O)
MTSQKPRIYSAEGVVLRHHNLGEADRIVTLLTPGRGILRAVAKGARKPNSKLGGQLDLVRRVSISARSGRTLDSISQAETIESYAKLKVDLDLMAKAFYLCELTEKFAVEDAPAADVYRMLIDGLSQLESTAVPDLMIHWYEMRLLQMNGSQPQIQRCVDCGDELEQEDHVFSAMRGGIACPRCRPSGSDTMLPASVATIKLLRFLQRAGQNEIERLRIAEDERRQVERILREHIHFATDRTVRSANFVDEVRSQTRSHTP